MMIKNEPAGELLNLKLKKNYLTKVPIGSASLCDLCGNFAVKKSTFFTFF
jgi:hypothetical protein